MNDVLFIYAISACGKGSQGRPKGLLGHCIRDYWGLLGLVTAYWEDLAPPPLGSNGLYDLQDFYTLLGLIAWLLGPTGPIGGSWVVKGAPIYPMTT